MKKSINQWFFRGFCLVLLISTTSTLHAQWYDDLSKEEKEQKSLDLINEAEYVVEGIVKDHECFYAEGGKTIYTAYTIEVAYWYKGMGENTIQLIKKGGVIGTDYQINTHDPGPSFGVGPRYIFLLRKSFKEETFEFVGTEEAIAKYKYMSTDKSYLVGFYGLIFNSNEDLNTFFSKANKIKISTKKKDVDFQKSSASLPINITSISPAVIRAGIGEILTIRGTGFGAVAGNVLFRDADKPTAEDNSDLYLLGLDDIYIVDWIQGVDGADDVIRVKVPSEISEGGPMWHGAGSGKIIIELPDGTKSDPSNQILTIEYSLMNLGVFSVGGQNQYPMSPPFIAREHCLDGFVFTLHDSFSGEEADKINARASIEAALVSWKNVLGITLELERKSGGGYQYVSFKNDYNDFRAIISFNNLGNPKVGMITQPVAQWDNCSSSNVPCFPAEHRRRGGVIQVNSIPFRPWHYSHIGDLPPNKQDFYAAILHEIGHYLGVSHDIALNAGMINNKNLMAHAPLLLSSVAVPADERVGLSNYNNRAVDAATNIVNDSRMHVWTDDFRDRFGIQTLASEGNNSMVLETPDINAQLFTITANGSHLYKLVPQPFDTNNDYYWSAGVTADWRWKWACGSIRPPVSTHYVRIKNDACTVASQYSLPKTIGEFCLGLGRDDDNSAPIIQPLISIYPNPTKGHFNIQFNPIEGEEASYIEDTYVGVYDNLGNLQKQYNVGDTLRQTTIDISTLPAGTYWVVWFADGEVIDTQQVQKTN